MIWVTLIRAREIKPPTTLANGDNLTDRICPAVGSFDHRKVDALCKIGKGVWKEKELV